MILFKNNYLTLRSKVKVPRRSFWYATHRLMVMHPHTNYHWHILKDKNVMARTRKYYLKKQLFDLEVKGRSRSLRYATHHLMVMHPHTKYNWQHVLTKWVTWQELLTLHEHLCSLLVFDGSVLLIFIVFCVVLFVLFVFVLCLVYQCCQYLWILHCPFGFL